MLVVFGACTTVPARVVPLSLAPARATPSGALEVVVQGAREPLAVQGSDVAFAGVPGALQQAVLAQAPRAPAPWRVTVELTDARATLRDGALSVQLTARSTVRSQRDHAYLGQAQQVCSSAATVSPEEGAGVVQECLTQLARDVAAWLSRPQH
jgi:outer membrane receptor protein involved in Fe transport